jgi:hypothetical protein
MKKIEKKKGKYDKIKMFKDEANLSPSMEFLLREEITDLLETADFRIEWSKKHKAPYPFSNLDQSQKQPEGKSDVEEAIDLCVDMAFDRNEELDKPEKQEEWREELKKILWHTGDDYICSYIGDTDLLIEKVSQLLSERTFTKEELLDITSVFNFYQAHTRRITKGENKELLDKIDNLLKEEE